MSTLPAGPSKYQGFLFFNSPKSSESYPDVSGKITLEGKEFEVAAWERTKDSKKFLVCSIRPKGSGPIRSNTAGARPTTSSPMPARNQPPQQALPPVQNGMPNSPFSANVARAAAAHNVPEPVRASPPAPAPNALPSTPFGPATPPSAASAGAADPGEGEMDFNDIFSNLPP